MSGKSEDVIYECPIYSVTPCQMWGLCGRSRKAYYYTAEPPIVNQIVSKTKGFV